MNSFFYGSKMFALKYFLIFYYTIFSLNLSCFPVSACILPNLGESLSFFYITASI